MTMVEPKITQRDVGPDGKVALWDLAKKQWVRRYPVDARELCLVGSMSMKGEDEPPPAPDPTKPRREPSPARKNDKARKRGDFQAGNSGEDEG